MCSSQAVICERQPLLLAHVVDIMLAPAGLCSCDMEVIRHTESEKM